MNPLSVEEAAKIVAEFVKYELEAGLITELDDEEFEELSSAVEVILK